VASNTPWYTLGEMAHVPTRPAGRNTSSDGPIREHAKDTPPESSAKSQIKLSRFDTARFRVVNWILTASAQIYPEGAFVRGELVQNEKQAGVVEESKAGIECRQTTSTHSAVQDFERGLQPRPNISTHSEIQNPQGESNVVRPSPPTTPNSADRTCNSFPPSSSSP
jgi:hypothetical protein